MRPHRIGTWALTLLVAVGWLGTAGGAWGQSFSEWLSQERDVEVIAPSPTPRTFGTASSTAHVVFATEFAPLDSSAQVIFVTAPALSKFSSQTLFAGVRLPAGAVVQSVELEGCDFSALGEVTFVMFRAPSPTGPQVQLTPFGGTGIPFVGGCTFIAVAPLPAVTPLFIDNERYVLPASRSGWLRQDP
jgi:hypothetical protein